MSKPDLAANRIDYLLLFDVADGNPNGDPDAGNAPRTDPETGQGLVSDVALKRKVRDYVAAAREGQAGHGIYVKIHSALHERREPAYQALELDDESKGAGKASAIEKARAWMCQNYYDVRTFGAVMSVEDFNCGQVRGAVQVTFARSVDPIADLEQTIVRKAVERKDAEKQREADGLITGTIGRKSIVPYGLYRAHAFYNPHFARDTGFTKDDLDLFVDALKGMFDIDRSSARGHMSTRKLLAFEHSSPLGNAPAAGLFERIGVKRRDSERPPRAFADYEITVAKEGLPKGVTLRELL